MSKSPFEIRTDILMMAKDYMDKVHAANVELAERMAARGQKSLEELQEQSRMYAPEDLIKQAEQFYNQFVCKKNDK